MSYGMSAALQGAVWSALSADATLAGLVGDAIFDAAPTGAVPATYVALGPERVRDGSTADGGGAVHDFTVSVVTEAAGFQAAKAAAAAVSDVLTGGTLSLSRGRVVGLWFLRARAERSESGALRRIDLTFRARLEDD